MPVSRQQLERDEAAALHPDQPAPSAEDVGGDDPDGEHAGPPHDGDFCAA